MSYYPERDRHIRDKVRVVLDLPNYATKKEKTERKILKMLLIIQYITTPEFNELTAKKFAARLK